MRRILALFFFMTCMNIFAEEIRLTTNDNEIILNRSMFDKDLTESEVIELYNLVCGIWLPEDYDPEEIFRYKEYSWGKAPSNPLDFVVIDLAHTDKYGFLSFGLDIFRIRTIHEVESGKFIINRDTPGDFETRPFSIVKENNNLYISSSDSILFFDEVFYKFS